MFAKSISRKVMLGYVAILLTVIFAGVFLSQQSKNIGETSDQFIEVLLPELEVVESISNELSMLQLSAFAFYGTTINADQFNKGYRDAKNKLSALVDKLHDKTLSDKLKSQELEGFYSVLDQLNLAMTGNSVDWDGARSQLEKLQLVKNQLNELLAQSKNSVQQRAQMYANQIQQQIDNMDSSNMTVGLIILLIIIVAFVMSRKGIVLPAKQLANQLRSISSNMDLTHQIKVSTKDELADIAQALNALLATFKTNAQTGKSSAKDLMLSAESLGQLSGTVKNETQQFSNYIGQLNQEVSVVEGSILEASEKSQLASDIALTGAEQAEAGAKEVNSTARGIDELSQDLQVSSDALSALKDSGDQVSAVVETIAGIAEQTNLLALNAAIEAARAGESGRGFAVVADEVRQLATRTHESTNQINEILATIVKSISDSVGLMQSNQEKAQTTVEHVHQTVASLEQLRATILKLSDDNKHLAQLTQSNESVIGNMRENIAKVVDSSTTIAKGGEDVHQASNQLTNLSTSLNDVSNKFKT